MMDALVHFVIQSGSLSFGLVTSHDLLLPVFLRLKALKTLSSTFWQILVFLRGFSRFGQFLRVRAHTFLFVICRRPPLVGAGSHFLPGEPTPGEMSKTQGEIPAAGGLFLVSSAAGGTIPGGKQQTDAQQRSIIYGWPINSITAPRGRRGEVIQS